MTKTPKLKKSAIRLIARSMKQQEKGKLLFRSSSESLARAVALGLPFNVPIELRDGRTVYLRDVFADASEVGGYKVIPRYKVEPWKEPRPAKAKAVAPEVEGGVL